MLGPCPQPEPEKDPKSEAVLAGNWHSLIVFVQVGHSRL